jgi:2,3-bisphosphoglycerate-dependent phosphoglycerate mutase
MAKLTEIVLVRHAETTMISDNRIHGQFDAPLTEDGIKAAQKTAEIFRGQSFDAFYASSLGRAMRTAEIIGEAINMRPVPVDGLRERNYGWLEGKPLAFFEPDLTGPAFMHPYIKFALHASGEGDEEFPDRVLKTTEEIIQRHAGQRVLLVIHWGILSILTRYFRGEDMHGWQSVGPWTACGISEIHKNGSEWQIIRLDDHSHL